MDKTTVKRISPIEGHYTPGHFGDSSDSNIILHELKNLKLYQIAFWPETRNNLEAYLKELFSIESIPDPNQSIIQKNVALMRIEPLKISVLVVNDPIPEPEGSVILDLSHSRLQLQISGPKTTTLLNGFLPIDLRETAFPIGKFTSTSFHHVGITLWRTRAGYNLFIPRGFSLSLWELLLDGAAQFGYDVI